MLGAVHGLVRDGGRRSLARLRAWTEEVPAVATPQGAIDRDGAADPGLGNLNPRSQWPGLACNGGRHAPASVRASEVEMADPGLGDPDPPHRPP
jgi:hypothetical protein